METEQFGRSEKARRTTQLADTIGPLLLKLFLKQI